LTTFLKEQFVTTKAKKNIYNNFFMSENYINIYNNLINYSRNKDLYQSLNREDNFSDRLTFFLIHFAFFLKNYKNKENKDVLQKIYDFNFRQLELSIREIGYGDQSINKKMKVYLNLFHAIVSEIHFWDELDKSDKLKKLSLFLEDFKKIQFFVDYFDDYNQDLKKKSLTFFLKGVSKS
jgi:cytochrome b pre-mRNA-processing protein 3